MAHSKSLILISSEIDIANLSRLLRSDCSLEKREVIGPKEDFWLKEPDRTISFLEMS